MPHMKSAWKRMRSSAKRQQRNRSVKSTLHTARKALVEATENGDRDKARAAFDHFSSLIDKAAKKGVIKRGNADRNKSRASARLAKLQAAKS